MTDAKSASIEPPDPQPHLDPADALRAELVNESLDQLADRIVSLDERIRGVQAELDKLKEERAIVESVALPLFAERGVSKLTIRGRTVHLYRSVFASVSAEKYDAFVAGLDALGIGHLAERRVNPSRLTAVVREWLETETGIPEQVKEYVEHGERYSVRSRAAQ